MTVHFTVIADYHGRILHVLSGTVAKSARSIDELVSGDVQTLLSKAREQGADFSGEVELRDSGAKAAMAAVHSSGSIMVISASDTQELTAHFRSIKNPNDPVLIDGDIGEGSYDQITRLNNELINTQRELAKLNARYSRDLERLGEIIGNIGSGIIVLDGKDNVEMMNDAAAAALGVKGDPTGRSVQEVYRIYDGTPFEEADESALHRFSVEADGRIVEMYGSLNRIGSNNKVIAFQDISELLRLERELKERNELLRLILKVTRHDLSNNLTVAQGYIDLSVPDEGDELLRKSSEALSKANMIIKQMKDMEFLVLERGERERKGLAGTVETVMGGHGIEWTIGGDAEVLADPALPSVIDNMVSNAIRHGNADRIDFQVNSEDQLTVLSIADNGSGIPPEIKDRLFQEGFSYGNAANTGLGLYLADQVMQRYGGSISVEDNQPSGARFLLRFPRSDPVR